jgi:hypothetical protein
MPALRHFNAGIGFNLVKIFMVNKKGSGRGFRAYQHFACRRPPALSTNKSAFAAASRSRFPPQRMKVAKRQMVG